MASPAAFKAYYQACDVRPQDTGDRRVRGGIADGITLRHAEPKTERFPAGTMIRIQQLSVRSQSLDPRDRPDRF